MKLELIDHPARTVNDDGELVPLLPDMRAVKLDGKAIGYCTAKPGFPVTLCYYVEADVREAIKNFVEDEIGEVTKVSVPPTPEQIEAVNAVLDGADYHDDDEDEDDESDDADQ